MPLDLIPIGQKCFACPSGPASPGGWVVVEKHLSDGTYVVMPVGSKSFVDRWEGVTRHELSVDDQALWPAAFTRLRGDSSGIDQERAGAALSALGYDVPPDQLAESWPPGRDVLDEHAAYKWFTKFGYGAALFVDAAPPPHERLYQFYWNSLRMGGRAPSDIGRPITLTDARMALELSADAPLEGRAIEAIDAFERAHGLRVPPVLRALWATPGSDLAICEHHPNNPRPRSVADWAARRAPALTRKSHAIEIMDPHQGDHTWLAVFDDGDEDAEIWIELMPSMAPWRCAPTSASFFWDLAETHRAWEQLEAERVALR